MGRPRARGAERRYGLIRSPALAGITGARRSWTVSMISALSIPRRYTKVRVPELPLDDRDRDPLPGHLDSVSVPQLVWSEPPTNTSMHSGHSEFLPCG